MRIWEVPGTGCLEPEVAARMEDASSREVETVRCSCQNGPARSPKRRLHARSFNGRLGAVTAFGIGGTNVRTQEGVLYLAGGDLCRGPAPRNGASRLPSRGAGRITRKPEVGSR